MTSGQKGVKMGCFWPPAGNSAKIPGNFPPADPRRPPPGRTPRIFRGEILGFSTVFWRIFPRKTGVFSPGDISPKSGRVAPPGTPRKFLPAFLLFCRASWGLKPGKRGVNGRDFGGNLVEISRNFPKSPEILPRAPPGAPRKNPPGI